MRGGALKKTVSGVLATVLLFLCFALVSPVGTAADFYVGSVNLSTGAIVRSGAGDNYDAVKTLAYGDMVTVTTYTTALDGSVWLAVQELSETPSYAGFLPAGCITPLSLSVDEAIFELYLDEQNFPESYRQSLRNLHAQFPEWRFEAVHTGLGWSTVVSAESRVGRNLVPRSSPSAYINTSDVDSNGKQISRDGYSWVAASTGIVQYYLDPRNFLNENYIFMFESLSYSKGTHTKAGVEAVLRNSFMYNKTYSANGSSYTYSETFIDAAEATGVSPYHLASRVVQEQGYGGSQLSYGTVPGYSGYFNFFNINATPSGGRSSVVNGAIYAKSKGWNNRYDSIVEGSAFIGSAYIKIGQDTIYFQKFDVVNPDDGYYWHQYMTNVMAPTSESPKLRSAYQGNYNVPIVFRIPVYLNMPAAAVPRPSSTNNPSIRITTYRLSGTDLSKINPGSTVSTVLSKVSVTRGTKLITSANGATKNTGAVICTGDTLLIYNTGGTIYRAYPIVIYGDVNGDGTITVLDLLAVQKHLIAAAELRDAYYDAADLDKSGTVTAGDLLRLQKYLLSLGKITQ